MKKVITVVFSLIAIYTTTAQLDYQNGQTITVKGPFIIDGIKVDNSAIETANLRFANPLFAKATINKDSTVFMLRYNIFQDEMEFLKDNTVYYLNKEEGKAIHFTDSNTTYITKKIEDQLNYVKVLNPRNPQLFCKENVAFVRGKVAKTQFDIPVKTAYKRKNDAFYLSIDDAQLIKVPKNKRAFYKLFKKNAESVKKFVKSNNLDIRNQKDLVQITQYINSI